MVDMLPAAIVVGTTIIGAAWAMTQGAVVGASAEVEGKSTIWGSALNAFGAFMIVLSILFSIVILAGGEGGMIPESAWPLLTGAITLIGSGFAASLAVMVAAKAGTDMLKERPELTIWSLLFVALGEGLAIFGLIVTILMISSGAPAATH